MFFKDGNSQFMVTDGNSQSMVTDSFKKLLIIQSLWLQQKVPRNPSRNAFLDFYKFTFTLINDLSIKWESVRNNSSQIVDILFAIKITFNFLLFYPLKYF